MFYIFNVFRYIEGNLLCLFEIGKSLVHLGPLSLALLGMTMDYTTATWKSFLVCVRESLLVVGN